MIDEKWEKTFLKRLQVHYDELKWLYFELYHDDEQAFDYFCEMLHDSYAQRPEKLKAWDQAREAVPDWYKGNELCGMQIGNPQGCGKTPSLYRGMRR